MYVYHSVFIEYTMFIERIMQKYHNLSCFVLIQYQLILIFRITALTLGHCHCPSASQITLKNITNSIKQSSAQIMLMSLIETDNIRYQYLHVVLHFVYILFTCFRWVLYTFCMTNPYIQLRWVEYIDVCYTDVPLQNTGILLFQSHLIHILKMELLKNVFMMSLKLF